MDCMLCHEPITNPLCDQCLGKGVVQWLQECAPERVNEFEDFAFGINSEEGETCISCKNIFVICTYCSSKEFFNWLKDGKLQISYLKYFNFFT